MKPIVTWVLVANTQNANVLENRGPGRGLSQVSGLGMHPDRAELPRDRAGVGHSIGGPGVSAVEHADPQGKVDAAFAREVAGQMSGALAANRFDRLIVAAGPEMLGLLRNSFDTAVQSVVIGEIDKDLSNQDAKEVASHIEDVIAV